jgi:hypothetical protein
MAPQPRKQSYPLFSFTVINCIIYGIRTRGINCKGATKDFFKKLQMFKKTKLSVLVTSDDVTAAAMKIIVLWDATPCSLVAAYY